MRFGVWEMQGTAPVGIRSRGLLFCWEEEEQAVALAVGGVWQPWISSRCSARKRVCASQLSLSCPPVLRHLCAHFLQAGQRS